MLNDERHPMIEIFPEEFTLGHMRRAVKTAQERVLNTGPYFMVRLHETWNPLDLPNFIPAGKSANEVDVRKAIPKGLEFLGKVERCILVRDSIEVRSALSAKLESEMSRRESIMAMFPKEITEGDRRKERALRRAAKKAQETGRPIGHYKDVEC